jgi:hypothetical protein
MQVPEKLIPSRFHFISLQKRNHLQASASSIISLPSQHIMQAIVQFFTQQYWKREILI